MKYSTNLSFFIFVAILSTTTSIMASNLKVGFYHKSCPSAETIVRNVVNKAISQNPGLGAGLIRMHFHDCFVRGCDASILLDPTPGNQVEKQHPANNPSLRGFEVIDEAKAELEAQCPETVSCADIIAFTARDSASRLGGINYAIKSGRRDGTISSINDPTGNLPRPDFNLNQLNQNFANKGLSLKELVTLSGAHTIGISHCSAFTNRLYSFNSTHPQDPTLDPNFALILKGKCPNVPAGDSNGNDPTVFFDFVTPNRLDNEYYVNLQNDKGILTSDEALMSNPSTVHMVRKLGSRGGVWAKKFAKAMVRMGSIQVLTGNEGEIRRNCRLVNS